MADYNFNNKEVDDIVASYTAYKGKFTSASRKLELLVDLQSKNYSAVMATNINEHLVKTERIVDILAALAEWLRVNRHPKREEFILETDTWSEQVRAFADSAIKLHHAHTVGNRGPGQNPAAPNVAPAGAGAVTKADQELWPPKLNNDTTMGEWRDWKEQFTSYYNSSNLRQMTYLQQQGYLLSTLDKDIGRHLRREITVTTPLFPTVGSVLCFDILTAYFSQRNPIHLRRQAFFCASQKEGQGVLDFRAHLRSLGNEGDLESMTVEGAFLLS